MTDESRGGRSFVRLGDLHLDSLESDPVPANYDSTPWLADLKARTLDPSVTERFTFHFIEKASGDAEYDIRVNFEEGTFLDITIDQETKGGGRPREMGAREGKPSKRTGEMVFSGD